MDTVAIIPAAGYGRRMENPRPKPYLNLGGRPVLAWTLQAFEEHPEVDRVYLAVAREWVDYAQNSIVRADNFRKVARVIAGGKQRQDSVYCALKELPSTSGIVIIHDGARPFLPSAVLSRAIEIAKSGTGACAARPLTDTIKRISDLGLIEKTLPRERFWAAQTPQVFPYRFLWEAYRQAGNDGFLGTDDASLVERLGYPVKVIPGSPYNIKITTADDLRLAELILKYGLWNL